MRLAPANALLVGRLPRATIPDLDGQLPVRARIVAGGREQWVEGTAKAWTRDAVCVWWTDRTDPLQRIDGLAATDIIRAEIARQPLAHYGRGRGVEQVVPTATRSPVYLHLPCVDRVGL